MKIKDINGTDRDCQKAYIHPNWPGFVTVEFVSKHRKGYKHTEWYPIDQFLQQNPTLTNIVKPAGQTNSAEVVGVVSRAGKTSLTDQGKNWQKNIYAGYVVWISRGAGEGQVRTIIKNSATALTIDQSWTTLPDQTSQYVVTKTLGDVKAAGNQLPETELKELEERARKMDLERGREPAKRQYTQWLYPYKISLYR